MKHSRSNPNYFSFLEVDWTFWKSLSLPEGYWEEKEHHKQYFDWLARKYNITEDDQWQSITTEDIQKTGGSRFLNEYNG